MWKRPWNIKEGFAIGAGILVLGALVELLCGSLDWSALAFPVNIIVLIIYLCFLGILFLLRKRFHPVEWMMHGGAAVPSIAFCAVLTFIMGLTGVDFLGFWPFILSYFWMTTIIGLSTLNRISRFRAKDIPFILNHLGLFVALVAGTLGSPDVHREEITVTEGATAGKEVSVTLHSFRMEQYPPVLRLGNDPSGSLRIDNGMLGGRLGDWDIEVLRNIPYAGTAGEDSVSYRTWLHPGACCAMEIKASRGNESHCGWVSCGSFLFPPATLDLGGGENLMMAPREARKYTSEVTVNAGGRTADGTIEVNRPMRVSGWTIYQQGYDVSMGEWSDTSILRAVRNPWLPLVMAGIFMLIGGALASFMTASGKRKEDRK
ncbi:MAG: cytochrome c biogenesis protein ResB [Candidatus Cryptobacteroides sp.]